MYVYKKTFKFFGFLECELPKKYVLDALDELNCYRAQCVRRGYELELSKKKRIFLALKAKNVNIPEEFHYLNEVQLQNGDELLDIVLEEDVTTTEATVLLKTHDENLFKRRDIAKIVLEAEFLKGRSRFVFLKIIIRYQVSGQKHFKTSLF